MTMTICDTLNVTQVTYTYFIISTLCVATLVKQLRPSLQE